ncbi:aa3 type cytochrome c oxidase subunit IV [Limimonas halophila]|uniref:Aa3 type cytochrome c oxidase subunit IV n=1 Tax=Limimonas halophila TaxID=1082479 RepID=A0A1G7P8T0_9PROT|nr:aa3-type cytochrome c oxidase subunit IV [Limimonas halophila]SDF82673.1 aa3 type cytochrome c oxidase subunit IV [Limimonas halophila]
MTDPNRANENTEHGPMASETTEFKELERERKTTFGGVMKLLAYSSAAIAIVLALMFIFLT